MRSDALRTTAIAFAIGYSIHVLDHARRGIDSSPRFVFWIGAIQGAFIALAIWMALTGRERAPVVAMLVGFGSVLLFANGHLFPFSPDSYVSGPAPGVTWFSWMTAVGEIGTAIAFGIAGARLYRRREPVPATQT